MKLTQHFNCWYKSICLLFVGMLCTVFAQAQINVVSGGSGLATTYTSLTNAGGLFADLNAISQSGQTITVSISGSVTESGTNALTGAAGMWTSLTIYPTATVTLSGTLAPAANLIVLSGATNVTIDGRINATGSTNSLTIENDGASATTGATILFQNEASNNTVKYCDVRGAGTGTSGTILIGTTTGPNGNDNIVIDYCNVFDATTGFPTNGVNGVGTAAFPNDNVIISNCNIYNFYNAGGQMRGAATGAGCNGWTITANSFYQTATRVLTGTTAPVNFINISSTSNTTGFTITNNYFGGNVPLAASGVMTFTASVARELRGVILATSNAATPNSFQGNVFKNFSFTTTTGAGNQTLLQTNTGNSDIGTTSPNIFGDTTTTGSIVFSSSGSTGPFTVIQIGSAAAGGMVNCQNNVIGSITVNGSSTIGFRAIGAVPVTSGTINISGNTIGSKTVGGSITVTSNGIAIGIYLAIPVANSTQTVSNNTISNMACGSGQVIGISNTSSATGQVMNITDNTISSISQSGTSLTGIISSGATTTCSILRNKIYDLTGNVSGSIINGIAVTSGTNVTVANNIIGDIRTPIAQTGSITAPSIRGININSSLANSSIKVYYNTVYLNAVTTNVTLFSTTAMFHTYNTTATTASLDLRNNIFVNNSTPVGTGKAVAFQRSAATNLNNYNVNSNNNDFYAGIPSASNVLFFDGTNSYQDLTTLLPAVTPREANSISVNPTFLSTTGSSADFLHINPTASGLIEGGAANVAGITTDFDNEIRQGNLGYTGTGAAPDMGADEVESAAGDVTPPVISYSGPSFSCSPITLTATITDATGVATSAPGLPVLYWKIDVGGSYTAVTGTYVSGSDYSFSFGAGASAGQTIFYYIVAMDTSPAKNITVFPLAGASGFSNVDPISVSTPPTSPSSYFFSGPFSGVKTVGASGADFATIGDALFAYNNSCLTGPVTFKLIDNSYTEASPVAILNNAYASAVNTLTIMPHDTVTSPITFTSADGTANFDLNGAQYVTIDGRPGGIGTSVMLNIVNTAATGVAIRITNDASNNTITYCDVQGQNTVAVPTLTTSAGVIFINSANATTLQGNDNNTISNCNIHGTGPTVANFPNIGIASFGTVTSTASYNDNCTITNCNIYDYFNTSTASTGIKLDAGNTAWTITNNHFYQTTIINLPTGTAVHRALWITPNTASISNAANGFIITGNYIGGSDASGAGTYTMTGTANYNFYGMDLSIGLGAVTSVQNNTITNMNFTGGWTGNSFYGINIANGNADVGTVTGNLIGSTTTNGAITCNTTVTGASMIGLRSGAGGTINFSNNIISGIDMIGNATNLATGFNGIAGSGGANIIIDNNTVGSATLANSINMMSTSATSTTATAVRGIICNSATAGVVNTITNNLVANINSNYTATGSQANTLVGISVTTGTSTISGNTVRNLSSATQTTGSAGTSAIVGLAYTSTTAPATISDNTIHSLNLTNPTATAAIVNQGIYYAGPTSGTNVIERNMIHSLSLVSPTNSAGILSGMVINTGLVTIKNNMIRMGYDETGASITSPCTISGISKNIAATNIHFNSIYIGGTGVGATATKTFAIQKTGNAVDDWSNNILVNNRSNATTGGKHYSISLNAITTLTLNFNAYYGTGTGYMFGLIGAADVPFYSLGWVTGDNNSITGDPQFINPTGNSSTVDLHIDAINPTVVEGTGNPIGSVIVDFDGQTRSGLTPTDIGADAGNFTPLPLCSGTPPVGNAVLTNAAAVCGPVTKTMLLQGYTSQPGYSYQWQESITGLGGSFVDVTTGSGGTTISYTTAALTDTTYFQCIVTCTNGGAFSTSTVVQVIYNPNPALVVTPASGSIVCSNSRVDLTASGAATYAWSGSPGVGSYNQDAMFISSRTTAQVSAVPTSTLSSNTANPPAQVASPTWTYTVTGTGTNGCTSSAVVVLNVVATPEVPLQLTYTNSPDTVCAPGTPVTITLNNSGSVGVGTWTYNWYSSVDTSLLQTATNTNATDTYTPPTPAVNGNYSYIVKVTNSECPASYAIAQPSFFIGYTSTDSIFNANCGNNGIITVYPEGQKNYTTWYANDFTTGLIGPGVDDDSYTLAGASSHVMFTGGKCVLAPMATSKNGALLVRNPAGINTNNLQIDYLSTTTPLGFGSGILGGGGYAWSYAPDVWQGTLSPSTGGLNAENGSGSALKIVFDGTPNGFNTPGAYLMYNCNTLDQNPFSLGVIAFVPGNFWHRLSDAQVSITITENGLLTYKLNNLVIFDHVQLPAEYLAADKSTWIHAFTSRTGAADMLDAIDDLSIKYNSYEYSINSTTGLDGTWQSANNFSGLAAATYPVWVRNPSDTTCFANTGNAIVGTSPSPTSAITVAAPGFQTTVCAGSSTTLTTDVAVPGATFLWESSDSLNGTYIAASGINNVANYETDPLVQSTYFRCTFTCPASSAITSTPVLVTVNIGSIDSTNTPQLIDCIGDAATLTVVPGANTSPVWYIAANGGSPVAYGNSYTVTPVTLPVTYYVEPVTTLFTNHFDGGGQKVFSNGGGTYTGTSTSATRFTTSASIRIDSIKVYPITTGTLTVALQNSGSSVSIATFTMTVTTTGSFINVPVNLVVPGSGNYQLTTTGISCNYYNSYTATYNAPYMSMGGVMTIIGSSTTATGSTSTSIYGTSLNWSITTSCPAGFGNRVPVVVQSNPATAVTVTPAATSACSNVIQMLTYSSPASYDSTFWTPITNLFTDAAATIPYTTGFNTGTVYFKSATAVNATVTCTATNLTSGCKNSGKATVSISLAPTISSLTSSPAILCSPDSAQFTLAIAPANPNYVYSWSPAAGLSSTSVQNPMASPSSLTTYTVSVINSVSGCTVSSSVTLDVTPKPKPYLSFGDTAVCSNVPFIYLSVHDSGAYAGGYPAGTTFDFVGWTSPFNDVDSILVDASFAFTCIVTLPASMGSCAAQTAVSNVDFGSTQSPQLGIEQDSVDCFGESNGKAIVNVTFGGVPRFRYQWYSATSNALLRDTTAALTTDTLMNLPYDGYYVIVTDHQDSASAPYCQEIAFVLVEQPAVLAVSENISNHLNVDCNGNLTGAIDINVTGGTMPYSYNWSNSTTDEDLSATGAGTYTCTITDYHGCSTSITVTITEPTVLTINCEVLNNVSCFGGSDGNVSVLGGGGTLPYTISPSPENLTAGTYTFTITDGNGCTATCMTTVTEPALFVATISGTLVFCSGSSTTLDAGVHSGYIWSTGETTQMIAVTTATTFTVTVTNNIGCTASTSVATTVNSITSPIISGSLSFCAGSSTTLDAGSYSGYLWSTGETTQMISVITAATYTVTVTGANGCTESTSVITTANPLPVPSINGSLGFCPGGATTLDAGNYDAYLWSSGETTQIISVTTAAAFTVTVTNSNGCSGSSSVTTSIYALPEPVIAGQELPCNGNPALLDAGMYAAYLWSNGATTQILAVASIGTYTVTVTNANGCTASAFYTVIYSGNAPSKPVSMTGSFIANCIALNQVYTCPPVANATSYFWTVPAGVKIIGGQGTNSITVNYTPAYVGKTGVITVASVNTCGMSAAYKRQTSSRLNSPVISGSNTMCAGDIKTYSVTPVAGALNYTWTKVAGSTILSGQGTTTVTIKWGSVGGLVKCSANNACGASIVANHAVSQICAKVAGTSFEFSDISLYPNPALTSATLKFESYETGTAQIEVYDLVGKQMLVRSVDVIIGNNQQELNLSNFTKGIYTVQLRYKGLAKNSKLIVQ